MYLKILTVKITSAKSGFFNVYKRKCVQNLVPGFKKKCGKILGQYGNELRMFGRIYFIHFCRSQNVKKCCVYGIFIQCFYGTGFTATVN